MTESMKLRPFVRRSRTIPLSARDAAPVYFESDRMPANMVVAGIVDAAALTIDRNAVERWMGERLDCSPIFNRKLRRAWADLTYPTWAIDPDFNLSDHVTVTTVDDWREAEAVISRLLSTRMDLTRPPWDLTVIDGVSGLGEGLPARAAIAVLRLHHSTGDGVAFAATLRSMLAEPPERPVAPAFRKPRSVLWMPVDLGKYVGALIRGPRLARAAARVGVRPAIAQTASRFNDPVRGQPTLGFVHLDFEEIQEVRQAVAGSTLNDVVVTVVAGALRRLLSALDGPLVAELSAVVPITVADLVGSDNKFALGRVALHAGETDPIERLRRVQEATTAEKERQRDPAVVRSRSLPESLPAYAARAAGRRAHRARDSKPGPVTMISNVPVLVPDPAFLGARVVRAMSFPTIFDGMTLTHTVLAADGRPVLAFTADSETLPDPAAYEGMLREAFDELLAAVRTVAAGTG